jgi:hypothetical protein
MIELFINAPMELQVLILFGLVMVVRELFKDDSRYNK